MREAQAVDLWALRRSGRFGMRSGRRVAACSGQRKPDRQLKSAGHSGKSLKSGLTSLGPRLQTRRRMRKMKLTRATRHRLMRERASSLLVCLGVLTGEREREQVVPESLFISIPPVGEHVRSHRARRRLRGTACSSSPCSRPSSQAKPRWPRSLHYRVPDRPYHSKLVCRCSCNSYRRERK